MPHVANRQRLLVGLAYVLFALYWIYRAIVTGETWTWLFVVCLLAIGVARLVLAYRRPEAPPELKDS